MTGSIQSHIACMFFSVLLCTGLASSQTHFHLTDSGSEHNMSVNMVPPTVPTINGVQIESGDEIAIFDSLGQCFGHGTWEANQAFSIVAFGYDAFTGIKGFSPKATFHFRIWDASKNREATAKATYNITSFYKDTSYVTDGFSLIASLTGTYVGVRDNVPAASAENLFTIRDDAVMYTLSHSSEVKIAVFDLRGRCMLSYSRIEQPGAHQLLVRNLHQGCYLARFSTGSEVQEMPIIIGK